MKNNYNGLVKYKQVKDGWKGSCHYWISVMIVEQGANSTTHPSPFISHKPTLYEAFTQL